MLFQAPTLCVQAVMTCVGSNGSERIAHLCRLNKAFAARLYVCSTTCTYTTMLVNSISFGPSHVTYRICGKSSFKYECAAIRWGHDRPPKVWSVYLLLYLKAANALNRLVLFAWVWVCIIFFQLCRTLLRLQRCTG